MKNTNVSYGKLAVLLIGLAAFVDGAVLLVVNNLNLGNIVATLLGAALVAYGICWDRANRLLPKWVKIALITVLAIIVAFAAFLLTYGSINTATYTEDAVIVLGAGLRGDTPSLTLQKRLDAAVAYHERNPDVLIVVSGGQGPQEIVSEASAMEQYLLSCGVPQANIVKEERSTSTYENFVYSKTLLDERLDGEYRVAFVTSEYHVYRAGGIARSAGIENTTHLHGTTRLDAILPGTLREILAVLKFWVFGT